MSKQTPLGLESDGTRWFVATGAPRSGTTMFARLLNTHPGVGCVNEVSLADLFATLRPLFSVQAERDQISHMITRAEVEVDMGSGSTLVDKLGEKERLARQYRAERDDQLGGSAFGTGSGALDAVLHGAKTARSLIEIVLGKPGLARCGSKYPNLDLVEAAEHLSSELPNLRLMHIVRRPRDVVNSSLARRNGALLNVDHWHINTVAEACKEWMADWNRGQVARDIFGDRLLTVKYEDLMKDGPQLCEKLARHLDVANAFDPTVCRRLPNELTGYALTHGEATVVDEVLGDVDAAWDAPLTELLREFPRVAFGLPPSGKINFGLAGEGYLYTSGGFSIPEDWGRWTDGDRAWFDIGINAPARDLLVSFTFQVWTAQPDRPFEFVIAAGEFRTVITIDQSSAGQILRRAVLVPRAALMDANCLSILIYILTPKTPSDEPTAELRRLGLGLETVEVKYLV